MVLQLGHHKCWKLAGCLVERIDQEAGLDMRGQILQSKRRTIAMKLARVGKKGQSSMLNDLWRMQLVCRICFNCLSSNIRMTQMLTSSSVCVSSGLPTPR